MSNQASRSDSKELTHFTIDGQAFETSDPDQLASALLANDAKVSAQNYQLGELEGHNPNPRLFRSDETVHIRDGARFVTVRIGPGPVE